jgi:hypothetical protein
MSMRPSSRLSSSASWTSGYDYSHSSYRSVVPLLSGLTYGGIQTRPKWSFCARNTTHLRHRSIGQRSMKPLLRERQTATSSATVRNSSSVSPSLFPVLLLQSPSVSQICGLCVQGKLCRFPYFAVASTGVQSAKQFRPIVCLPFRWRRWQG